MTEKKKPGKKNPDAGLLRKQAEKIARKKPENVETLSPAEASKLIHELSVHQIELKMQNDELRASEKRLEEAREQYFSLYDMAPVGYFSISEQGTILEANFTGATMLGVLPRDLRSRQFTGLIFEADQDIYYYHWKQLFAAQKPQVFEARIVRKDGTLFWALGEATVAEDGKSGKPACRMTIHDITERKQAEETLRKSEERWQFALEGAGDGLWDWDAQTNQVYFSHKWKAMLGYGDDEIGNTLDEWDKRIHPDDRERTYAELNPHLEGSAPTYISEHRVLCKDGTYKWILDRGMAISRTPEGKPLRVIGTHSDISLRKEAEYAVRESEARLREVLDNSLDASYKRNLQTKAYDYLSPTFARISGYAPDEMNTLPLETVINLIHPDDSPEVQRMIAESLSNTDNKPYRLEYRFKHKQGHYRWVQDSYTVMIDRSGQPLALIGSVSDITERKQAEAALRESMERHRVLLQTAMDGFWMTDMQGRLIEVNEAYCRMSGYSVRELLAMHISDIDTAEDTAAHIQKVIAQGEDRFETRQRRKDGSIFDVEVSVQYRTYEQGNRMVGFLRDITEIKKAEESLRQREQDYSTLVENIPDMIVRFDTGLRHIFCNAAVERHIGVPGNMFIGKTPLEIAGPEEQAQFVDKALRHTLETGVEQHVEQKFPSPTGERLIRTRVVPERDDKGNIKSLLAISSDITDRKRVEEERQRVSKLEAVGVLAGGIAHDFNNILTSILGNISLAGMEATPGSELQTSLGQAEKASLRAKALTVKLLTFSKGGAPVKKLASLTEMLKDTAVFALSGSNVKCHFYIAEDLWHAEIDEGQVSQVIHNLVINAQQAMPTGGAIELTAQNMALSETQSLGKGLPLKAGDYVRIAVADHGIGIPAENMDKIFDPFFSTKPKGSGLGLATSFSIARQHGGHLSVESEPGSGSTFYLYLPATTEMATAKQDDKETINAVGKARILVMDDEKGVREIAGRMLKHIGYEDVEFAKDGTEAIELYKAAMETGKPFTVAILDLTIAGGMGGEVTIRKLLEIDPGVKAIVSSGYIDDPVMAGYGEYGFSGVVAKPYTIPELRKAVQDVIG